MQSAIDDIPTVKDLIEGIVADTILRASYKTVERLITLFLLHSCFKIINFLENNSPFGH